MYKLIGKQHMQYISKKTGSDVCGYKLFFTYASTNPNIEGLVCDSVFVSEDLGYNVQVNDCFDLFYNKFGKVIKLIRTID